jgi:hypothetical protein
MKHRTLLITTGFSLITFGAAANQIFTTPSGATTSGGAVDASASFDITGAGTLQITLTDLLANPTDVAQLLSDLSFVLSGGQTSGTLSSSSGQKVDIDKSGNLTLGSTTSTGWGLNNNVSGGLQLDALGFVGPAGLIIGPPGTGGTYADANSSIAGNKPHNPFINQTATFTLSIPGLTTGETITSATFSFGTTPGIDVPGTTVPDGGTTAVLLGTALTGLALLRRKLI